MYARSTSIRGNISNLDAGIAYVRDEMMPSVKQTDGCVGLSLLADRESGRCIVTTSWADADAMRAATEDVHTIRLMQARGAQSLDIQEWEIAVMHRERPAGDGAGATDEHAAPSDGGSPGEAAAGDAADAGGSSEDDGGTDGVAIAALVVGRRAYPRSIDRAAAMAA